MKGTNESDVIGVRDTPEAGEVGERPNEEALRGAIVHDRQGAEIGQVDDVVLGDDGRVASVVVEVGGYVGIGSHVVSVDARHLAVRHEDAGTRVVLGMTRDELRRLPAYGRSVTPPVVPPHPR